MKKDQRKTFYVDNNPVTAGGVILYRFRYGIMELLMMKKGGKWEDMGGKMEKKDASMIDGIMREAWEETNGLIDPQNLKSRMNDSVYVPHSKYMIYIVKSSSREKKLETKDFGNIEHHEQVERKFDWVPMRSIFSTYSIKKRKMNFRLMSKPFFDCLLQIEAQENRYGSWKPWASTVPHAKTDDKNKQSGKKIITNSRRSKTVS